MRNMVVKWFRQMIWHADVICCQKIVIVRSYFRRPTARLDNRPSTFTCRLIYCFFIILLLYWSPGRLYLILHWQYFRSSWYYNLYYLLALSVLLSQFSLLDMSNSRAIFPVPFIEMSFCSVHYSFCKSPCSSRTFTSFKAHVLPAISQYFVYLFNTFAALLAIQSLE